MRSTPPRQARWLARLPLAAGLLAFGFAATVGAHPATGHGGGHSAGGGHAVGHAVGGSRLAAARGGYAAPAWHGGYRGGGYGARVGAARGYYGGGGYRHWGPGPGGGWHGRGGWWHGYWWGGAVGLGLLVATVPWYYDTIWWGGVPYYYADDTFYRWRDDAGRYEVVAPPGDAPVAAAPAVAEDLYVYPKDHQSDEQQRQDRYECHRWASDQTGFDPTQINGGGEAATAADGRGAYRRAETACLTGRGYSVR